MKLKDILAKRVSEFGDTSTQESRVADWLNAKAGQIIHDASEHLRYVSHVFEEFDIHDAEHSEGVLGIIEDLLGDKAENLSSYDLFSLIAVSYLHDCGMAVSDYEMEVLKMVEGKLDGQKLMAITEAKDKVRANLSVIYGPNCNCFYDEEIQHWMFRPANEETLINYLAELLIDYQSFRNGNIDKIKECNDENLASTNDELRTKYLRITHHQRIKEYIINWGDLDRGFADFPISGMGRLLANNIAKCCQAHGEDAEFMKDEFKGETHVLYSGPNASNLQFIAMMLRLGDIIHFNYDRAHPVLRALHHYKSDYSYHQWYIKSNGLSFDVSDGRVTCTAYFQLPKDYYNLWSYVNYIDHELKLFNALSSKWDPVYQMIKIEEKVDRENIRHDASFTPAHGHKFSLDQNKVLELLMGAKLYANEYACLRELYQNSMDACRCQMAIAKSKDINLNSDPSGRIEFGLGEEKGKKYVYCLDNGKGMTKDIIEKFLLHVGSSYYRSSEFFKKQAETGYKFTPTSQFGIGMLSCFMIGDEIEITTREEGGNVVSCVMEGPNEYFYYKLASREDSERIPISGTLVKVFLNKEYQQLLNDDPINDLGYLLWYTKSDPKDETIKNDIKRWQHNLYQIMNGFILLLPDGINVDISLRTSGDKKETFPIKNKPLPITKEMQAISDKFSNQDIEFDFSKSWYKEFKDNGLGDYLDIWERIDGIKCHVVLEVGERTTSGSYKMHVYGQERCSVDGLGISDTAWKYDRKSIIYRMVDSIDCVLDFYGENRPQLSVNREDLVNTNLSDYDRIAKKLLTSLIEQSIEKVCEHIKDRNISSNDDLYDVIWNRLFDKYSSFNVLFYNCLKNYSDCYDMHVPYSGQQITFRDLFNSQADIPQKVISDYRMIRPLISMRLLGSNEISIDDQNNLTVTGCTNLESTITDLNIDVDDVLISPSGYEAIWNEYDAYRNDGGIILIPQRIKIIVSNNYKTQGSSVYGDSDFYFLFQELYRSVRHQFERYRTETMRRALKFSIPNNHIYHLFRKSEYLHDYDKWEERSMPIALMLYTKGLSILVYAHFDDIYNSSVTPAIAMKGKHSRQDLVNEVPRDFWEDTDPGMLFIDGTVLRPRK